MNLKKISEYPRGTLYSQLVDAYSFDDICKEAWNDMWMEYDNFFYLNRNRPYYVEIGHNCILTKYKFKGY